MIGSKLSECDVGFGDIVGFHNDLKIVLRLKSNSNLAAFGGLCLVVEFYQKGCAINAATLSSITLIYLINI